MAAKTSADEWLELILDGVRTQDDRFLEAVQTYDYYMDGALEGELVVYVDGSVMKLNDAEFETMESMQEVEEWFQALVKDGDIDEYKLTDTTSQMVNIGQSLEHLNKMLHLDAPGGDIMKNTTGIKDKSVDLHGFDTLAELYEGVISDALNGDAPSNTKMKCMRAEATKHNLCDGEDCQVLEFADGSVLDEELNQTHDNLAAWHTENDDENGVEGEGG